ncbi:MAG TPA: hypothetical protein VNM90_30665 [Haliangium sp.]|nr:hypothetical protein [Haliangium sp.]
MTKRSVSTDALDTLGTLIDDKQKRDAIHLAVEPVVAGEDGLLGGNHITVRDGAAFYCAPGDPAALGIVDPFLTVQIKKGDRFWFVMYPRMVHSLRHVWTHPAFPDEVQVALDKVADERKAESERWLREHIEAAGFDYDHIMEEIKQALGVIGVTGEHNFGCWGLSSGSSDSFYPPDDFWMHAEIVLGIKLSNHPSYFACSC